MKYWVYKESRILGPFDKEAVSGFPGLDEGTLVCAGDPAGSTWAPAGELADLSGLSLRASAAAGAEDFPSSLGLLDRLQIETAGVIGDEQFPGALAEQLFQDADLKKSFSDVLSARRPPDDSELRRSREKVSELPAPREDLDRRISELEAGHTDLARRLAEKDLELRRREEAPAAVAPKPAPLPPAVEVKPPEPVQPAVPSVPVVSASASAWMERAPAPTAVAAPPPAVETAPPAPIQPVEPPPMPALAPRKKPSFGPPKSFKVVPTVKSFRVVGSIEAGALPAAVPPAPVAPTPTEPVSVKTAPEAPVIDEASAPILRPMPPLSMPVAAPVLEFAALDPRSIPAPEPAAASSPPNTLNMGALITDMTVGGGASGAPDSPASDEVLARFAKPGPAPASEEPLKPRRSNKPFLIVGTLVVLLLVAVSAVLMRQPKEDLKRMASLDDGKSPVGVPSLDEKNESAPAPAKPPVAAPAQEQPPAQTPAPSVAPPGPPAEHEAAISMVKDFPLDGERGTVGRWLQYSYTAGPGAGTEAWNASTTADKTVLVEYRLVPGPKGGNAAVYLFEADMARGLVIGKNLEARRMLAGGPPPEPPKARKKPAPKRGAARRPAAKQAVRAALKRPAAARKPKEVPLLPLPDSGELLPPSDDADAFTSY